MSESNRRRKEDTAIEELTDSVRCLHISFEKFNKKYSPILDIMIARDKYWVEVKEDVIKKTAVATVWGILGAIGVAIVYYVQTHLGIDVSAKK